MDRDSQRLHVALGRRVRELRLERQMTQEDMMDHGFSLRHYQHIEAGSPITTTTIWKLARAFDVTPRMILPADSEISARSPGRSTRGAGRPRRA